MRPSGLGEICARVAGACATRARITIVVTLAMTALLAAFAVPRLGIDTGTEAMIDPGVPFRRNELAFDAAFPQLADMLVIVVDATTPADAEWAAAALAHGLTARTELFTAVRRPDTLPFLETAGVLYLPTDVVAQLIDRLVAAQPMLAPLAADPSARGLAGAIDLLAEGLARSEVRAEQLKASFEAIAASVESVLAGRPAPLAWDDLLAGEALPRDPRGTRRIILTKPVLDAGALVPGAPAMATVRAVVAALGPPNGVRIRMTGPVALDGEELATVASGAEWGLVLSFALVAALLGLALRSWRLVGVTFATLVIGLIWTTGFAALAVGTLNLISVAFGIMFVGIAVDFGLQYAVRYGAIVADGTIEALGRAGRTAGGAMTLASAATASGFLAFLPTDFDGVGELGLIAGAGMVIALVLNLTLLPAAIASVGAPRRPTRGPETRLAATDAALAVHHRAILAAAGVAGVAALVALPFVRFDVDPLNLKDQGSESVATLRDLLADPLFAAYGLDVIVPAGDAEAVAARLAGVPEVGGVRTLADFLPRDQDAKLAILGDAAFILGPTLAPARVAEPPVPEDSVAAMRATATRLVALPAERSSPAVRRLANAFDAAADRGSALMPALDNALVGGVSDLLGRINALLATAPVTEAALPPELVSDWRSVDLVRIVAQPAVTNPDSADLARFVDAVHAVAPQANGMAASVVASGHVVVDAFLIATALAAAAIVAMLGMALRRVVDVLLVLAPLLLATALTFAEAVVLGIAINFANIIALPLLLGIGVSFPIYLVVGWRAGVEGVVQTPTARAVLFSALTTGAAFGSLALSRHPGTAAMGGLLLMAIANLIVCNLIVLPALLAAVRRPSG